MGIVNPVITQLVAAFQSFQTHPITEAFAKFCLFFEFLIVGASVYYITDFYFRLVISWKKYHKTGRESIGWFGCTILLTTVSIFAYIIRNSNGFINAFVIFMTISCLFMTIIPKLNEIGILNPFIPYSAMVCVLYVYDSFNWIFLLSIAILITLASLPMEKDFDIRIRRFVGAPLLSLGYFGLLCAKRKVQYQTTAAAIIGALISCLYYRGA